MHHRVVVIVVTGITVRVSFWKLSEKQLVRLHGRVSCSSADRRLYRGDSFLTPCVYSKQRCMAWLLRVHSLQPCAAMYAGRRFW